MALRNEWVAVGIVNQDEGPLTAVKGKHDERRRRSASGPDIASYRLGRRQTQPIGVGPISACCETNVPKSDVMILAVAAGQAC